MKKLLLLILGIIIITPAFVFDVSSIDKECINAEVENIETSGCVLEFEQNIFGRKERKNMDGVENKILPIEMHITDIKTDIFIKQCAASQNTGKKNISIVQIIIILAAVILVVVIVLSLTAN